eukprot:COSAG05_NODE_48_length_24425_cov_90.438543_19_plen_95_part_00
MGDVRRPHHLVRARRLRPPAGTPSTSSPLSIWMPLAYPWGIQVEYTDCTHAQGLAPNVSKMVVGMNYPTFMDPTSPSMGDKNFGTISQRPYLFW